MNRSIKLNHTATPSDARRTLDFSLRGVLTVRVVDATPSDATVVARLMGEPQCELSADPDFVIQFVDRLAPRSVTYLGLNAFGFDDDGFYLLDHRSGRAQARLRLETLGRGCQIDCQRGVHSIPLLLEMITALLPQKGYVGVHASAFRFNGVGTLVMGWTKGGKTEALLSFAKHGAEYLGDECVILSRDGDSMFGLPIPVTLWDWQFKYLPSLLPPISWRKRLFFQSIHWLDALHRRCSSGPLQRFLPMGILGRVLPGCKRQLKLVCSPEVLFKGNVSRYPTTPSKVFLMMSHDAPEIRIEACSPLEAARRMTHSNRAERLELTEAYQAFKFAFPHLESDCLEQADELEQGLLCRALSNKETYKVLHPYPCSLDELFAEMQPFCLQTSSPQPALANR